MKYLMVMSLIGISTLSAMRSPQENLRNYINDQSRPQLPTPLRQGAAHAKVSCFGCCSLSSSSSGSEIDTIIIHPVRPPLPLENQKLLWAIFNKDEQALKNALAGVPLGQINELDKQGWSALHYAAQMRYINGVLLLLRRRDIERNCVTDDGLTPTTILVALHGYDKHKGTDGCTYLIDQLGVDPFYVDSLLAIDSREEE